MQCIYEMAHLKHIPTNLGHLAGLLDLFKAKVVGINKCTNNTLDLLSPHIVGLSVTKVTTACSTRCEVHICLEALAGKP